MKTMKRLTLVLGLLLVATAVQAQLLWKVTGNGLGRPSYILGTHHMAPSTMIDQIKGMNEAIAGCDIVVGEVEKDSLMSPEVQARMAQAMVAPLDSTLDKVLTPADYGIVEKVFNKYFGTLGMKLKQVNNLKPSAISTQIVWRSSGAAFGYSAAMKEMRFTAPTFTPRKFTALPTSSPLTGSTKYVSTRNSCLCASAPPNHITTPTMRVLARTTNRPSLA